MENTVAEFSDLVLGMKVQDKSNNTGIVINIDDIHNIQVKFGRSNQKGFGLFCLDKECEMYEELFIVE